MMDLTFFTMSRPFTNEFDYVQRNAIESWKRLGPQKIILFRQAGADKGVAEAAEEFGCSHQRVQLHKKFRVPLIRSAFDRAQAAAATKLMCFLHCEMILMDDFKPAVELIANRLDNVLMIGRRWRVGIDGLLNFSPGWQRQVRERARNSKLVGRAGLSVNVFNRGLYKRGEVVRAMIGRNGEDLWLVTHILRQNLPVVDMTKAVMLIHQKHPAGVKRWSEEIAFNDRIVGDVSKGHAGYATWELTEDMRLKKRKTLPAPKWYPRWYKG